MKYLLTSLGIGMTIIFGGGFLIRFVRDSNFYEVRGDGKGSKITGYFYIIAGIITLPELVTRLF